MHHLKRYFLVYTLVPLIVVSLAASYLRFMVTYDYEVIHEGFCDPYQEQCYVYCEDEECVEPFYYTTINRRADSLRALCGDSLVSECDNAQSCQPTELSCTVTYCDLDNEDGCETLDVIDLPREVEFGIGEVEILQDNYTDL